jgi:hypothetical protein
LIKSLVKTPGRSDEWSNSKLRRWENAFDSKTIFVNKGKKNIHSIQILASLALLGPSTTREISKFVITQSENYPHQKIRDIDSRIVEQMFLRLIDGRQSKKTGKRKSLEKYPGLESNYYVRKVGKREERDSNLYTLTLSGFFFALGFDFNEENFKKFLNNAANHHIFFGYVKKISETTSIPFVKKIFLDPVREIIEKNRITLDENISFYFSNIAESIGRKLDVVKGSDFEPIDDDEDVERLHRIKEIEKWTYYDDRATSDWYDAMIDIFYPNENEREFFVEYAHDGIEKNMLYKIMQKIHLVYFGYGGNSIPRRTQNIPVSSKWKEKVRWHPKYKNPRDYDKKHKIMIRYDADYIRA